MNPSLSLLIHLGIFGTLLCLLNGKPLFYIYDWPTFLDDVWPPADAQLHPKSGYHHDFRPNNGSGKLVNAEVGLFQTWQFSLYKHVVSRLRVSEFRTRNPAEAVAFIIPFDLGVNSYIDHLTGFPRLAAPHGRDAGRLLRDSCNGEQASIFWKYRGHDHFLIFSITAYQMVGMQVKYFFMFVCQNCTVLTIETSPTKVMKLPSCETISNIFWPSQTAIPGRTRKHYYAMPYPSSFHWHEGIKTLPWTLPTAANRDVVPQRDIVAFFIGSIKTAQPTSRALRQILFRQCSQDSKCLWHETPHACNGVVNASATMLLFRRAQFCPAPAGDSITRKASLRPCRSPYFHPPS